MELLWNVTEPLRNVVKRYRTVTERFRSVTEPLRIVTEPLRKYWFSPSLHTKLYSPRNDRNTKYILKFSLSLKYGRGLTPSVQSWRLKASLKIRAQCAIVYDISASASGVAGQSLTYCQDRLTLFALCMRSVACVAGTALPGALSLRAIVNIAAIARLLKQMKPLSQGLLAKLTWSRERVRCYGVVYFSSNQMPE